MPRQCTGRIPSTQHLQSWGSSDGTPVPYGGGRGWRRRSLGRVGAERAWGSGHGWETSNAQE